MTYAPGLRCSLVGVSALGGGRAAAGAAGRRDCHGNDTADPIVAGTPPYLYLRKAGKGRKLIVGRSGTCPAGSQRALGRSRRRRDLPRARAGGRLPAVAASLLPPAGMGAA